jgi:hypothetical protein
VKKSTKLFLAGVLSYSAILSISQDIYGLERYIVYIRENWIDSSITIPLALFMLTVSFILWKMNRYE